MIILTRIGVSLLLQMLFKPLGNLSQQMIAGVAAEDAVVAVGIDILLEVFVSLDKCLCVLERVLRMHIVIS